MKGASSEHVSKPEPQPSTSAGLITKPSPAFRRSSIKDDSEIKALRPSRKNPKVPNILPAIAEVPDTFVSQLSDVDPIQHPSPEFHSFQSEISDDNSDKFLIGLIIVLSMILVIMVLILLLVILEHK